MSPDVPPSRTAIGATLRDARRRYGLEVREVEERTKIRARYIRALENEDWETLPAPAYVRGFLRTYGQLLGLDGEMLADEFRRRYGDGPGTGTPTSGPPEPLLSERRRPSAPRFSRGVWIVGILVGIVLLVLILGLLGGGSDDQPPAPFKGAKAGKQDGGHKDKGDGKGKGDEAGGEPVQAVVVAETETEVCLVAGGDEALIDSQVLQAGARESFDGHKNYHLDVGPGKIQFVVGGAEQKIETSEPVGYDADSSGIHEGTYEGPDCP
jgi:cytoskeleton protein RodZ